MAQQNDPKQISGNTVAVDQPSPFQSYSSNPDVGFLLTGVQPPSNKYIGRDDQLLIRLVCGRIAQTLTITYRLLLANGKLVPFQSLVTLAAFTSQNVFLQLSEGFLLSVTISNSGNVPGVTAFAQISLLRTNQTNPVFYNDILASGYVTANRGISFPGVMPVRPTDGRGNITNITGSTPAPGAEISEGLSNLLVSRLISFTYRFIASAAVASRAPALEITDGVNLLFRAGINFNISAGSGYVAYYGDSCPNYADTGNTQVINLPSNLMLGPSFQIKTQTNNLQAGDQYDTIHYLVEEWVED